MLIVSLLKIYSFIVRLVGRPVVDIVLIIRRAVSAELATGFSFSLWFFVFII